MMKDVLLRDGNGGNAKMGTTWAASQVLPRGVKAGLRPTTRALPGGKKHVTAAMKAEPICGLGPPHVQRFLGPRLSTLQAKQMMF